jgi:hypothetical protein
VIRYRFISCFYGVLREANTPYAGYVFSPQLALTINAGGVSAYAGAGYQSYKTKQGGDWLLGLGLTPVIAGATAKVTVGVQPQ